MVKDFSDILMSVITRNHLPGWDEMVTKSIGYEIFKKFFDFDEALYNTFWEKIVKEDKYNKYSHVIKFYYFWCKRPSVDRVLLPEFKFIVMESVIEFLMSDATDAYIAFSQWLDIKFSADKSFKILDKASFKKLIDEYFIEHGGKRKIKHFFSKYCSPDDLSKLQNGLKKWDEGEKGFINIKNINELVEFLDGVRSSFIHYASDIEIGTNEDFDKDAEGFSSFFSSKLTVVRKHSYEINNAVLTIDNILEIFERGVKKYFEY